MNNLIISPAPQGTQEWLEARAWCITGTRLKQVMSSRKSTREELIYELIAEKMAPLTETYASGTMERWHLIESVVKELYTEGVESVWFCKRADTAWLGISPDGIIRDGEKITKAIEVKWPAPKNTMKYFLSDSIPDEYFWQVVHYFVVIDDLESLDFIIANPDMYDSFFRMKKITVTRKELTDSIEEAKSALVEFYSEWQEAIQKVISLKPTV